MTAQAAFIVWAVGAVLVFGVFGAAGKNPDKPGGRRRPWNTTELCALFVFAVGWPVGLGLLAYDLQRRTT